VVAILSTGNELVDLQKPSSREQPKDQWGGIFDTNRPSLQAALEGLGYDVVDLGIVQDTCVPASLNFLLHHVHCDCNPVSKPTLAPFRKVSLTLT
jgi:gephyrin